MRNTLDRCDWCCDPDKDAVHYRKGFTFCDDCWEAGFADL